MLQVNVPVTLERRMAKADIVLHLTAIQLCFIAAGHFSIMHRNNRKAVHCATEGSTVDPRSGESGIRQPWGKGSHRKFGNPKVQKPVVLSGNLGDDALDYQLKAVRRAIEESKK